MDKLKRSLRVYTLALDFQNVSSILVQYFSVAEDKIVINIPFFNLLCKSYPDVISNILRNNVDIMYLYILRIKHPIIEECISNYPSVLVDAIRIHLERQEAFDVYSLDLGSPVLNDFIDSSSVDTLFPPNVDVSSITLPIAAIPPMLRMDNDRANILINFLVYGHGDRDRIIYPQSSKLDNIPLDTEMPAESLARDLLITPIIYPFLIPIGWFQDAKTYLLKRQINTSTQLDYDKAVGALGYARQILDNNRLIQTLQQLRISRVLLHNISAYLYGAAERDYNLLYEAFYYYPYTLTLSAQFKPKLLKAAPDVRLFASSQVGINYYISQLEVEDPTIPLRIRAFDEIDIRPERPPEQHIKYSIFEDISNLIPVPPSVLAYNTLQLANDVRHIPGSIYYDSTMNPVPVGEVDIPTLNMILGYTASLVPSNMLYNNLTEVLDYYLPLIPQTSITAILLLLLYNSTDYMSWSQVYKKHKEIMRVIIDRSSILSDYDKSRILTIII